jgi:phage-related minor tail protein
LDNAADVLEQAFKDGKITIDQYNAALANIDKARVKMQGLGTATAGTRGQIITLTRSLASGSFESAAFDFARLASGADGVGAGFARLLLPVGAVVGVLGVLTAASIAAWGEQRALDNALLITGNRAALTSGTFAELSREIEKNSNVTIAQAEEITLALARTGKFSSNTIGEYGKTIAALTEVTGQSAEDLAKLFSEMGDDPAKFAAKQNEAWRFLTAAQYENIRVMQERGDIEGAQLALNTALYEKYAGVVIDRMGAVETALTKHKKSWSDYWRLIKDVAGVNGNDDATLLERRQTQLDLKLKQIEVQNARRSNPINPDDDPDVQRYLREIFDLQLNLQNEKERAQQESDEAEKQNQIILARRRIAELSLRADRERQMAEEIAALQKDFATARQAGSNGDFSAESEAKLRQSIIDKYSQSTKEAAKAAENYVAALEQQGRVAGKTSSEIDALKTSELKLTSEQQTRLTLARKLIDAEVERQAQIKDSQQLIKLQIDLLRAQGREFEASSIEFEAQYGELLTRLKARGDKQGIDLVDQLLDLEKLQSRLNDAQKLISESQSAQQREEQSISTQREAGLITEAEARRRIVELHQQTYALLQQQKPVLEELAAQPGAVGESASAALASLNDQSTTLLNTVSLLESTLRGSIEQGLTDVITGLAKGTLSFGDAIKSLASTVADAIIRLQAEQIAQSVTGSLFGGAKAAGAGADAATAGVGAANASAEAAATATATAQTALATASTASATALTSVATSGGAMTVSFQAVTTAASALAGALSAAAAASAAAGTTNAVVGAVGAGASVAAATGGYITGPGTSTSDSIPALLSNGEFVARAAVVAQGDALNFLHDFNARGMAALRDWAPVRHSSGGLAGYPAPVMASPNLTAANLSDPATDKNNNAMNVRFMNIVDPSLMAEFAQSSEGERVYTNYIRRNTATIKRILGVP